MVNDRLSDRKVEGELASIADKGDRKIRVLVLAPVYPSPKKPYEAAFFHRRALQLLRSNMSVTVVTRRHITLGSYIKSWDRVRDYYEGGREFNYCLDNIPVHGLRLHMMLPLNYSKSAANVTYKALGTKVQKLHQEKPFDVIHLAGWGDFSVAGSRVAKDLNIPYIASAIGGYVNKFHNKPKSIPYHAMMEYFSGARKIMCVSGDLKSKVDLVTGKSVESFVFWSGVDRQIFYPNALTKEAKRKALGLNKDHILILTVCRINREKGIFELIEAFKRLSERYPNARLALVGPVSQPRVLRKALNRLLGAGKVVVLGACEPADVAGFLNAADVFVLPSWMEGMPNSLIEACACGVATVATRVGGIPDIVEDGVSGLLVEPKDVDDLLAKLQILLERPKLRLALGSESEKRVAEHFDHNRNAVKLANEFSSVVRR